VGCVGGRNLGNFLTVQYMGQTIPMIHFSMHGVRARIGGR